MTTKKITVAEEKKLTSTVKVYAKIEFGYSNKFVLPYEDGLALMHHFAHAEQYDDNDYNNHKITDLTTPPSLTLLSQEEYRKLKMITLLQGKGASA